MNWRVFLLSGTSIVALDQITKRMVLDARWLFVINNGFSFGFWQGMSAWLPLALLCFVALDTLKRGIRFPDVLILAGGVSNMIDRLFGHGVIDWIQFLTIWFNIADISITIGILWILQPSLRMTRSL